MSSKSPAEIDAVGRRLKDPATNPSHVKRELARDLVAQYHNAEAAEAAEAHFDRIHVKHDVPEEIDEISLASDAGGLWIVKALTASGMCKSSSDARRMIQQGAVSVDGEKLSDGEHRLSKRETPYTLKVGKRQFIRIRVV